MLLSVKLENYLTVGNLELDFKDGFIAVTGESGAGKSILLSAISATLGDKISSDCISFGESDTSITTVFEISTNTVVKSILMDYEFIDDEEDNELILRVVVDSNNRKKYFINGNITKQKIIKEVAEHLVSYFGQNYQLKLNDPVFQMDVIDRYADILSRDDDLAHFEVLSKIKDVFNKIKDNKRIIEESNSNTDDGGGGYISLLEYQHKELEDLNLNNDHIYSLKNKLLELEESLVVDKGLKNALYLIKGDDSSEGVSISSLISKVSGIFKGMNLSSFEAGEAFIDKVSGLLMEADELVSEVGNSCDSYISDGDGFSEEDYNEMNDEYRMLLDMAGKHNVPVDSLERHFKSIDKKLKDIRSKTKTTDQINLILKENELLVKEYISLAEVLNKNRIDAAISFESIANSKLIDLGFVNADSLIIEINEIDKKSEKYSENQFTENGVDKVVFMLQPNYGQVAKPLASIASGGELSRVSLVFESIVSDSDSSKVMIFDEIDTGVSSNISKSMAKLLKEISSRNQIFTITHSPYIAASGNQHILVRKSNSKINDELITRTSVKVLNNENLIIQEISRMLVGENKIINKDVFNVVKMMRTGEDVDLGLFEKKDSADK